jgi:hypothetical protein
MFDLVSVKSSFHGRERREQRQIDKSDAKLARRYGIVELGGSGHPHSSSSNGGGVARKYTYKGAVFVMSNSHEITCYHSPDYASPFSGTRVTLPILYPMDASGCSDDALERHKSLKRKLRKSAGSVSHTIFCVSMSSMMRQDDVNGARCRSDAIWAALARGLVPGSQASACENRLVSVVALIDSTFKVILRHEPVDSVLYNRLLSLRANWATLRPQGHAVVGDELICAIRSLFLPGNESRVVFIGSDDMSFSETSNDPSLLRQSVAGLVDDGGLRRVVGIALGDDSDAASTLNCLVRAFDEVDDDSFACGLKRVPLELDALIRSVADLTMGKSTATPGAISSSVSEYTDEQSATSSVIASNDEKWLPAVIEKVYMWSEVASDMAPLVDKRCASCWTLISRASSDVSNFIEAPQRPRMPESQSGWLCASCEARYYCVDCMSQFTLHLGSAECAALQLERQSGRIVSPSAADLGETWMLPSYRTEIEQAQSASAVVFAGQKLRYLTNARSHGSHASRCDMIEATTPIMVCHRIGHGHWEDVDPAVRRHYETVCRFHAIAGRIANAFSEQCAAASRPRLGSASGLQVRVQPGMTIEVKGGDGGGCYFVSEDHAYAAVKLRPSDLKHDGIAALEALGHYAIRFHHFPLLASKVIRFESESSILITDLIIQHSDAGSQQATEAFLRSHVCNNVCEELQMP